MKKFHKETQFKVTDIGRIPEDWEVVRLGEVVEEIYYGITAKATDRDTGLKILRTSDIKGYTANWESLENGEITDSRKGDIERFYIRKGDIIISRAGTVGVAILVEREMPNVIFGSYLIKVRFIEGKVSPEYFHQYAQSKFYWNHIMRAQGSTLKNINLPLLKSLPIPLPPLDEQRAIAQVLLSFDELLQTIDKQIENLERIKKGMMEVYFTKGVFEHREFKETEIGRIPGDWEVVRLGDVVKKVKSGGTPKTTVKEYYENGTIPFVKIEDLTTNGKYLKTTVLKITVDGLKNSSAWLVPPNSLLFSMYGSYGEVSINKIEVATNQAILGIIPAFDKVDIEFLYYWFSYYKPNWYIYTKTTTQSNLTKQIVKNGKIPLPPLEEQKEIARRLKNVDDQIENLREQRESVERMKKRVMDLLLTGKVRVKEVR